MPYNAIDAWSQSSYCSQAYHILGATISKSHVLPTVDGVTVSSTSIRSYTRVDTKSAKGVAVLLMLVHHLYAFPQYVPGGSLRSVITAFGVPLPMILGEFGKICVSIFFFLGGYGM